MLTKNNLFYEQEKVRRKIMKHNGKMPYHCGRDISNLESGYEMRTPSVRKGVNLIFLI
jgi:hypothetical protein